MIEKTVTQDGFGVSFNNSGTPFYFINWWQIERDGIQAWDRHLSEKNWYDENLRIEFLSICNSYIKNAKVKTA